jgi:hypothetical protein
MTGVRFADVQARPAEFLNLTSLTLEEFEALVGPFEAAFQGRRGGSMGNREPLHRLSDLPAGNAGRPAVLPAHLPEDLRRSSGPGAAVRHEPEQSQSVDPRPAAGAARGAPRPRRCPRPLSHGSGWLSRRGRSHRWRSLRPAQPPHPELDRVPPCMGLLMSSVFHRGFSILPIPMFDQRDHPSVPTMNVAGHGGGWRSRMARRATAAGGARRP